MSDYYIRSPNDYLEHGLADSVKAAISAALSGRTKSGHKYYKRISLGKNSKGKNKYEYFYSADEYAKWLKNQNEKKSGITGPNKKTSVFDIPLSYLSNPLTGESWESGLTVNTGGILAKLLGIATITPYNRYSSNEEVPKNKESSKKHYKNSGEARKDIKFKEDKNGKDPKGHKYLLRVTLPSGKYRYFYTQKEVDAYRKEQEIMKNVPKQDTNFTEEEEMSAVNPNFDVTTLLDDSHDDMSSYTNCWSCSIAYELRERGYDVQAISRKADESAYGENWDGGATNYEIASYFDIDQIADNCLESGSQYDFAQYAHAQGADTRGIITVSWTGGGGHAMDYTVDDDGKIEVRDCQVNKVYKEGTDEYNSLMNNIDDYSIVAFRTDNLAINKKIVDGTKGDDGYEYHPPRPAVMPYRDDTTDYANDSYYYKYDSGGISHLYDAQTGELLW